MRIAFERGNKFDLEFYGVHCQILGESATGKTYIFEVLQDVVAEYNANTSNRDSLLNNGKIDFIDKNTTIDTIKSILERKGYVICIDNAEQLLYLYPELRQMIKYNIHNHYLLVGRGDLGIYIGCESYFSIQHTKLSDGTFLFTFKKEGI